ncbi:uncharacterized protein SPPG_07592 [Spizellomyces punctatus DAOM BR117]|uniref:Uncharacterized protein n=1 Tax=Spizellomyces punctatus (strain DAOM BR117) TaxID=645134 RepID=A0A0L0H8C0_SPIPD|nr:uncharacterized protein SPPG_07592 [Spizellomyces punctatus DAOM BR117]KNC97206.1 hypothetical protein SPPG_07592 [Spizellomyces punctatus DAOM BR117]|eukprot:XP_016605246.1 hypothetical protein SPPG_07592 [Spizellomyces punctatus DAOM BR117]
MSKFNFTEEDLEHIDFVEVPKEEWIRREAKNIANLSGPDLDCYLELCQIYYNAEATCQGYFINNIEGFTDYDDCPDDLRSFLNGYADEYEYLFDKMKEAELQKLAALQELGGQRDMRSTV